MPTSLAGKILLEVHIPPIQGLCLCCSRITDVSPFLPWFLTVNILFLLCEGRRYACHIPGMEMRIRLLGAGVLLPHVSSRAQTQGMFAAKPRHLPFLRGSDQVRSLARLSPKAPVTHVTLRDKNCTSCPMLSPTVQSGGNFTDVL